jgi:hypothetical protein
MSTKAQLEEEIVALHKALAIAKGRHEALKKRVVKVAMKGCKEHGWCDEVKKYLREMKLTSYLPSDYVVQRQGYGGDWNEWEMFQRLDDAQAKLREARERRPYDDFRLVEEMGNGKIKVLVK